LHQGGAEALIVDEKLIARQFCVTLSGPHHDFRSMDLTLQDEEFDDRYFLRGRMEILNCLNDVIRYRENVTVYFNQGKSHLLTTLLEAGVDHLLFDLGGEESANRRLERAQGCVMVAMHHGIRIQFSTQEVPQRFSWGGTEAFSIPLPEKIVRLQRREAYRVALAVSKPVMARVTGDDGILLCELPIHDLSVGGIGMNAIGNTNLNVGDEIEVSFSLAKGKPMHCRAQVRHITTMGRSGRQANLRVGLSFVDFPIALSAKVQRYILQVEREREALVRKM
jgi:flagellar brake protein